jgi:hypothetical protein
MQSVLGINPFPQLSGGWAVAFGLLGLIPCCCQSPLAKDLWLGRTVLLVSLPAAFLISFSAAGGHPLILMITLMLMAALNALPLVLCSVVVQLGDGKDTTALFSLVGAVTGVAALLARPLGGLLSLLGVAGQIISFVTFVLAGVVLFCVWPRRVNAQ